ncbi:mannosyltransferase [Crepidotus variabilis]|uniref:GDP-Man:Man(3)GlcNAc(2)-PP-Dol alpha-1,2-mannosyltransferase n=1 Tax=Crepidotus variabilis TaxID=179855 RepID=A0A9P6E6J4_9AGAR|nr:mannosyltransferase [Crepidotus variabilis]
MLFSTISRFMLVQTATGGSHLVLSYFLCLRLAQSNSIRAVCLVLLISQPLLLAGELWILLRFYNWTLLSGNSQRKAKLYRNLGFTEKETKRSVGFWHPYCNAGGGGERVLWTAIAAMQRTDPDIVSVVYSGDMNVTKEEILLKVKSRFEIALDPRLVHFIFMKSRFLIEDNSWPHFTLLGQSLGSIYLVWEGLSQYVPDLFIDTMGYAFTFHVVALVARIPIGAYVHYPTISTDMLARVQSRKAWHTNTSEISSSAILSSAKLVYYRFFMYYYAISLRTANFLMVNSSWTKNHVDSILRHADPLLDFLHLASPLTFFTPSLWRNSTTSCRIVYPPCDTREMAKFALTPRHPVILSVAQFRPEKDHKAQVMAFDHLLKDHPEHKGGDVPVKLVLVGGSRNDGDEKRIEELRQLVQDLKIGVRIVLARDYVEIVINAPYPAVLGWLSRASIGLSTMIDEHFGINVVEFMAAGVIPIAHKSGGPLKDIILPFNGEPTGFHAQTTSEFADAMHEVLTLSVDAELAMRHRARTWAVQKFSEQEFEEGWNQSGWRKYLPSS